MGNADRSSIESPRYSKQFSSLPITYVEAGAAISACLEQLEYQPLHSDVADRREKADHIAAADSDGRTRRLLGSTRIDDS